VLTVIVDGERYLIAILDCVLAYFTKFTITIGVCSVYAFDLRIQLSFANIHLIPFLIELWRIVVRVAHINC
jgi:hypothetical protein